jgi:catechol 2,3-dioxygenase-like lactoylglutathione lyase family enzyme
MTINSLSQELHPRIQNAAKISTTSSRTLLPPSLLPSANSALRSFFPSSSLKRCAVLTSHKPLPALAIRLWPLATSFCRPFLCLFNLLYFLYLPAYSQTRPPITGIAHVRLYSVDLHASSAFYGQLLGLPAGHNTCLGIGRPCFSVNGRQRVELQQITGGTPENLLAEVAFSTPDVAGMREFLQAHKIETGPISKDGNGASGFTLRDPEGRPLAFVQQASGGFFTPAEHQISTRILHAGFIVKDLAKEKAFYQDLLGFHLYWRGGFQDNGLDWYEIQVPDGEEWIEFMLNIPANANRQERGIQNHFSLGVANANQAATRLRSFGAAKFDGPEVGRDGKNSLDIYDPDQTRVEIMDFKPTQAPCCYPYTAAHPKP